MSPLAQPPDDGRAPGSRRPRERPVRPASGEIREYLRGDGGKTFSLRVTIPAWIPMGPGQARRQTLPLGRDDDGWTRELAEKELERVLAHLTLGHWPIPKESPATSNGESPASSNGELSVVECGVAWIDRHPGWAPRTIDDRQWRLDHLQPFWSVLTPSQVTIASVDDFKAFKERESQRLKAAIDARTPERYESSGAVRRPLSGSSLNKLLAMLAMILEEVQERHGWGPGPNIARGSRRRSSTKKPRREFLEGDEAALFVIAARHIDRWPVAASEELFIETMRLRDDEKLPWREVARRTRVGPSTAHYRYRIAKAPHDIGSWEAMAIMLLAGGMRATECGDMTLEDLAVLNRHFVVPGTKTDGAARTSDMTDGVYQRMTEYVRTRRHDDPQSPAFPNACGESRDRHSVGWCVERVAKRAGLLAERDGLPFPSRVTPHDLRRTCVALLLSPPHPYDLGFVKKHVGNTSSELVLDIYNRLMERADRSDPAAEFDRILFGEPQTKPAADGRGEHERASFNATPVTSMTQANPVSAAGRLRASEAQPHVAPEVYNGSVEFGRSPSSSMRILSGAFDPHR